MNGFKAMLLSATAAAALLGASQPGAAFEVVDWEWEHLITGTTNVSVDIVVANDPEGLVQVEKLQAHFGDLTATATVTGVDNVPPGSLPGEGTQTALIDANLAWDDIAPDGGTTNPVNGATYASDNVNIVVTPVAGVGNADETNNEVDFQFEVAATFDITDLEGIEDAANLPMVENAATAVANNQSIEADVPLYLHDAQFAAGGFDSICGEGEGDFDLCTTLGVVLGAAGLFEVDQDLEDINEHTTIAGLLTIAAATGLVQPAAINATASVSDILNAYVDNAATAVSNNASFAIESDSMENHVMVADLTQWGYANLSASASVSDVDINNYTNFGAAGLGGGVGEITPIVANAATAVGNNLSISVGTIGE